VTNILRQKKKKLKDNYFETEEYKNYTFFVLC